MSQKAIHRLVLTQAIGELAEGTLIDVSDDKVAALIDAGVAREATEEDIGGGGEEEVVEDDYADPVALSAASVARLEKQAAEAVAKTLERIEAGRKATPLPKVRPTVPATVKDKTNGFRRFGEFADCVAKAAFDPSAARRLAPMAAKATVVETGNDPSAGYLVPEEWSQAMFERVWESNALFKDFQRYPMRTNILNIPNENPTSGLSGGVTVYTPGEAAAITESEPVFNNVVLTLVKYAALVRVSDELLEDNTYGLESYLMRNVPKRFNFKMTSDILTGTNSQANVIGNASVVTVTRNTQDRILHADIVNMYTRLYHDALPGARWFVTPSAYGELMKLAFGGANGTTPLFVPLVSYQGGSVAGAPAGTLYGLPVIVIEQCPALGVKGDIILVNPDNYAAGYREFNSAASMHLYFNRDEMTYRFTQRISTKPLWTQAWTRSDGLSASPTVVLSTNTASSGSSS